VEVCSFCGLFGSHKGHELTQIADLKDLTKNSLADIVKERESLSLKLGLDGDIQLAERLRASLKEKLTVMRKDLEEEYNVSSSEN